MPSAPASAAARARSTASAVALAPAPATTGTRPPATDTATRITSACSFEVIVALSPVVPHGTR